MHAGLIGWAFVPEFHPVGFLLIAGAAFNLWRLSRWRGGATMAEPLVLILHIGYGWLVLGTAMLGLATLGANVPERAAIHVLTAGAIGTMVLAIMTRVARGHTGRDLSADCATSLIYTLVTLAAITRVVATFAADWTMPLLIASVCLWIAAFGVFTLCYGPMLFLPRDPG